MKNVLFLLLSFSLVKMSAQVAIRTNLLHTIPLNKSLTFEVRVNKGKLNNFSRYQMEVPEGVVIEEVESRGGSFSFEENKAKIIWVVTPPEPEFGIRMKIRGVKTPQSLNFRISYQYMQQEEKQEFEAQPYVVNIKDTVLPVFLSAPMVTLLSKHPAPPVSPPVDPGQVNTKDPEKLKQQVAQLRKDSKEAYVVGEREKDAANSKLALLAEDEKKLAEIPDEAEKTSATEKHNSDKKKVEDELAIAERVLTLAQSLDANANEIERINKSVNPGSFTVEETPSPVTTLKPVEQPRTSETTAVPPSANTNEAIVSKEAEEPKVKNEKKGASSWGDVAAFAGGTAAAAASGKRVYKVQIGAFKDKPDLSQFKNLGKVTVSSENASYKVLIGNFNSKEEALSKKNELVSKGIDGFVVAYEAGQRVK